MDIDRDAVANWDHGWRTVGTSRSQLFSAPEFAPLKGVLVRADAANTADVYLGKSDVTADQNDDTGGFPVPAGGAVNVPIHVAEQLYAISTAASQKISFLLV